MKSAFAHTNLPPLPKNWVWSTMNDVCLKVQDGTHFSPQNQLPHGRYRYLTAKNIRPLGLDLSDVSYIEEEEHRAIYTRCDPKKGDVLLVKDGVNTGDVALNTLDNEFSLLSSVCLLRPKPDLLSSPFLRYFLQSPVGARLLTGKMTGTAIRRIVLRQIKETPIPIAPLLEQQSLVAEIEKQFSRLDEAVANLRRVKANLKRYKAAVLKAAVQGKLTEEWRKAHPDVQPASELLKRILADRRAKWNGQGKYKEAARLDVTLPLLPARWTWATLDQIGQAGRPIIYGIIKPGRHVPDGVPYVRVKEMKDGRIDVANLRRTSLERATKFARATLRTGDILISKDGTIGRVAVVPPELAGGNITQHVMRAPTHPAMCRAYIVWALRSDWCQRWLTGETRGVALQGVNVEDFRRLPMPIPPVDEQEQVVGEVERRLSIIEELDTVVLANQRRAESFRSSLLQRAFEGKLLASVSDKSPSLLLLDAEFSHEGA